MYKELLIALQAVFFYQPDGRGPCLAFEGEKIQLSWFRNYLVVVAMETKTMPRTATMWVKFIMGENLRHCISNS